MAPMIARGGGGSPAGGWHAQPPPRQRQHRAKITLHVTAHFDGLRAPGVCLPHSLARSPPAAARPCTLIVHLTRLHHSQAFVDELGPSLPGVESAYVQLAEEEVKREEEAAKAPAYFEGVAEAEGEAFRKKRRPSLLQRLIQRTPGDQGKKRSGTRVVTDSPDTPSTPTSGVSTSFTRGIGQKGTFRLRAGQPERICRALVVITHIGSPRMESAPEKQRAPCHHPVLVAFCKLTVSSRISTHRASGLHDADGHAE